MKNTILLFALLLLILPIINAQTSFLSEPYLKQNADTTLPLPCTIEGNYCSASAVCKTTIINPNNAVLYNNYTMSRNGAVFEINLTASDTSTLGKYQFNVVCADGANSASRFLNFNVTATGDSRGISLFLILVLGSFIVLIMGIAVKNEYLGFISGVLFMMTGIYALIYGVSNLADLYTRTIGFTAIGLGLLFEVASAYTAVGGNPISILGRGDDFGEGEFWE